VVNTLAYYDTAKITAVKSFIVQAPVRDIKMKNSARHFRKKNNIHKNFVFEKKTKKNKMSG
jgi:hypothetical protein